MDETALAIGTSDLAFEGQIKSLTDTAVYAVGNTVDVIINVGTAGIISGAGGKAIEIFDQDSATNGNVELINGGQITGDILTTSSVDLITNNGMISGIIDLGALDDVVVLASGSSLTGDLLTGSGADMVTADAGTFSGILNGGDDVDTLTLIGDGDLSFDSFSNFETTQIDGVQTLSDTTTSDISVLTGAEMIIASDVTTGDITNAGTVSIADAQILTTGSFTAEAGSVTMFGLSETTNGELNATGAVDLQADSTLSVDVTTASVLTDGTTYTVATGFSVVDASTLFDNSSLYYFEAAVDGGNALVLTARQRAELAEIISESAPTDVNLGNTATAIDAILDAASDLDLSTALGQLQTDEEVEAAIEELAPDDSFSNFGVPRAVSQTRSNIVSGRVTDRFGNANSDNARNDGVVGFAHTNGNVSDLGTISYDVAGDGSRSLSGWGNFSSWLEGSVGKTKQNADNAAAGFDANTVSGAIGLDYLASPAELVGFGVSFSDSKAKSTIVGDSVGVKQLTGVIYGAMSRGNWRFDGQVSFGKSDFSTTRQVLGNQLVGAYDATEATTTLNAAYKIPFESGFAITPQASFYYGTLNTDEYTETGGVGALTYAANSFETSILAPSVKFSDQFLSDSAPLAIQGTLGLEYDFAGDYDQIAQFSTGGPSFTTFGTTGGKARMTADVGASLGRPDRAIFSLNLGTKQGKDLKSYNASAKVRISF